MQDLCFVTTCRSATEIIPFLPGLMRLEFVTGRYSSIPAPEAKLLIINEIISSFSKKRWYTVLHFSNRRIAGFAAMRALGEVDHVTRIRGLALDDDQVLFIEQVNVDGELSTDAYLRLTIEAAEQVAGQLKYKKVMIQSPMSGPLLESLISLGYERMMHNVFTKSISFAPHDNLNFEESILTTV